MSEETAPDDLIYVVVEREKTSGWTVLFILLIIGIIIWAVISWAESYTIFPFFIVISGRKISRVYSQGGYINGY